MLKGYDLEINSATLFIYINDTHFISGSFENLYLCQDKYVCFVKGNLLYSHMIMSVYIYAHFTPT